MVDLSADRQARWSREHENMYTVYAISSTTRRYIYVGLTNDVERRFDEHNKGKERTTRPYAPFSLIYTEVHATRLEARAREKYFKSGIGKEFLRTLV
jgi:putative endonuclease